MKKCTQEHGLIWIHKRPRDFGTDIDSMDRDPLDSDTYDFESSSSTGSMSDYSESGSDFETSLYYESEFTSHSETSSVISTSSVDTFYYALSNA